MEKDSRSKIYTWVCDNQTFGGCNMYRMRIGDPNNEESYTGTRIELNFILSQKGIVSEIDTGSKSSFGCPTSDLPACKDCIAKTFAEIDRRSRL